MEDDEERSERIYRAYGLSPDDEEGDDGAESAWLDALDEAAYDDAETGRELFSSMVILHIDRLLRDLGGAAFNEEPWRITFFGEEFGGELAPSGGYVAGTKIRFNRLVWALANSVRHFDEWFDLEHVPRIPSGPLSKANIVSAILGTHVDDDVKLTKDERQQVNRLFAALRSMWTIERALHRDPWQKVWTWEGLQEIATPRGGRPGETPPRFEIIEQRLNEALKEIATSLGGKAISQLGDAERFISKLQDAQRRPR